VTKTLLVPNFQGSGLIFPSRFNILRSSKRWRPVSDNSFSCLRFSNISSIIIASCAGRLACDIGGPVLFPSPCKARCLRWRSRSSARAFLSSVARRARSFRARRRVRHALQHVFWVSVEDTFGLYQARHSQHRRRPCARGLCLIHPRSQDVNVGTSARPPPSHPWMDLMLAAAIWSGIYPEMDLKTAATWITFTPPPKLRQHGQETRLKGRIYLR